MVHDHHYYIPAPNDTPEALETKAYNCGHDLSPDDERAAWVDGNTAWINAYHAGQAERDDFSDYDF